MIAEFFRRRRARLDREWEREGFEYAAGQLLESNGKAADSLGVDADCGDIFGHTPFDDGVKRAVRLWNRNVRPR